MRILCTMDSRGTSLQPSIHNSVNLKVPLNFAEKESHSLHAQNIIPTLYKSSDYPNISSTDTWNRPKQFQKSPEMNVYTAVTKIENAWINYQNKQMFKLLKHSVCAAENSLSSEILKKVIPHEAKLLNDKSQQVKVRFRFGGEEFPPMIFFKIFIHNAAQKVKYLSGKKMIRPSTEAAEDSLRQMGNRCFYSQILKDTLHQQNCSVVDETDITTLKDYMQYLSNIDESPASLGGKENYWRKLTLDDLPRRTIFYDVVDFAYNKRLTPRLREEIPNLVLRPVLQEVQIQHLEAISKIRSQSWSSYTPPKSKVLDERAQNQVSGRRSKQAMLKALKMRQIYRRNNNAGSSNRSEEEFRYRTPENAAIRYELVEEDDWEREAKKLYEWTQELSFHDDIMHTALQTI